MTVYENLANAIVAQAADDYRKILVLPQNDGSRRSLERFFRSEWYRILTNLDGELLMQMLKKEVLG